MALSGIGFTDEAPGAIATLVGLTAATGLPDGSLSIERWLVLLLRVLCRDGANQTRGAQWKSQPEGTDNQAPVFTPCG